MRLALAGLISSIEEAGRSAGANPGRQLRGIDAFFRSMSAGGLQSFIQWSISRRRSMADGLFTSRSTRMKSMVLLMIVALGIAAGAIASAHADRMPADLWERLDRERY
jgi:hypothetical protein